MVRNQGTVFDPETIDLMRSVLDAAWAPLAPRTASKHEPDDPSGTHLESSGAGRARPDSVVRSSSIQRGLA